MSCFPSETAVGPASQTCRSEVVRLPPGATRASATGTCVWIYSRCALLLCVSQLETESPLLHPLGCWAAETFWSWILQVPGIRAMAEELGLTCIQAHRLDSTRAVLCTPTGPGNCSGAAPAVPGADGAAAAQAALALPDDDGTSAAAGPDPARQPGSDNPPPGHANGAADTVAAVAGVPAAPAMEAPQRVVAENERQRARRERKLAAVRARGLQPPPALLGAAPEPSIRCTPLGTNSRSRAAHRQPRNKRL